MNEPRRRYREVTSLGIGGMGEVHLGLAFAPLGITQLVAIKRPHRHLFAQPGTREAFADEARIAARVRHPNVVALLDVIAEDGELAIVMEYVVGISLQSIMRALAKQSRAVPAAIASAIACDTLRGLHAAHEAKTSAGEPLGLVHRDVSPSNIHVGRDGLSRVLDFGVAKAAGRSQVTSDGEVKGKIGYMAPERLRGGGAGRSSDLFAVGVILWEMLTGAQLFGAGLAPPAVVTAQVLGGVRPEVIDEAVRGGLGDAEADKPRRRALAEVFRGALDDEPGRRFSTAEEMALELARALPPASAIEVSAWLERAVPELLTERLRLAAAVEASAAEGDPREPLRSAASPAAVAEPPTGTATVTHVPEPVRRARRFAVVGLAAGALLIALVFAFSFATASRSPSPPRSPRTVEFARATLVQTEQVRRPARAPTPGPPTPPRVASSASSRCDPPFTVVDNVRVFKLDCVR